MTMNKVITKAHENILPRSHENQGNIAVKWGGTKTLSRVSKRNPPHPLGRHPLNVMCESFYDNE
jgi:hypothetical protein